MKCELQITYTSII